MLSMQKTEHIRKLEIMNEEHKIKMNILIIEQEIVKTRRNTVSSSSTYLDTSAEEVYRRHNTKSNPTSDSPLSYEPSLVHDSMLLYQQMQ